LWIMSLPHYRGVKLHVVVRSNSMILHFLLTIQPIERPARSRHVPAIQQLRVSADSH
jgi:hypothetical protein